MLANNFTRPILEKGEGTVVFQLHEAGAGEEGVSFVQGEMVLRNGVYMTQSDVRMRLEGVYMHAVRRDAG